MFPGRESRSTCRRSEGCGDPDGGRRITPRKSPSQRGSAAICNSSYVQQRQQRGSPIDFHSKRQKTYCCDQRYKQREEKQTQLNTQNTNNKVKNKRFLQNDHKETRVIENRQKIEFMTRARQKQLTSDTE